MFVDRDTGMGRVWADFDPVSFNLVEQAVDTRTDALWRADGGRDGKPDLIRTSTQRRADAIFELITGRNAGTRQPADGHPAEGQPAGSGSRTGSNGRVRVSNQLVVVADIGVIDGTDPGGRCEIVGTGPVPSSVIGQLSPDTAVAGMIFGGDGQPLWLGRGRRLASAAQHFGRGGAGPGLRCLRGADAPM